MHCSSCEILVEQKLSKFAGVKSADASLKGKYVDIEYKSKHLDVQKINDEFQDLGYIFNQKENTTEKTKLFWIDKSGNLRINKTKFKNISIVVFGLIAFVLAFLFFEKLQLGKYANVSEQSSLPAFFILGLVAGVSSCAALVGGILLSLTKKWYEVYIVSDGRIHRAKPHLMFHLGRLLSFAIFGGVLGLIGGALSISTSLYASIVIVVSVVMLVLALQMLEVDFARNFTIKTPKFIANKVADESNFRGKFMPFVIGASTFLLPCGFTLIAQGIALVSGSFVSGALIMTAFALGTLPVLGLISIGGVKFNSKPHISARFNQIAGIIIIFFVIYNINSQLNALSMPSLSDIKLSKSETLEEVETNSEGVQEMLVVAKGFKYSPQTSTTLRAGVPTKLVIDNQGIEGCGVFMAARGLFDGYVQLNKGINTVEFVPQKGTYKLTCSMGMVPPVTIKVN